MDILGSILKSMDKPPSVNSGDKQRLKKQQEALMKEKDKERAKLNSFRESIQKKVSDFAKDDSQDRLKFPPMDQIHRAVIHDVAEDAGLSGCSFGEEGVDRYIMLYKKDNPPSEDELATLRNGEEWNAQKAKELSEQRELKKHEEVLAKSRQKEKFVPQHNYKEKYAHLIGLEAAKDAAKKTEANSNKQYGFVPAENKKDSRSIEQTLADIQSKKRLKTSHGDGSGSSSDHTLEQ